METIEEQSKTGEFANRKIEEWASAAVLPHIRCLSLFLYKYRNIYFSIFNFSMSQALSTHKKCHSQQINILASTFLL